MISCLWSPRKSGGFLHISQQLPDNSASFNDNLSSSLFCLAIFFDTLWSGVRFMGYLKYVRTFAFWAYYIIMWDLTSNTKEAGF
jgi:hypothetical protein